MQIVFAALLCKLNRVVPKTRNVRIPHWWKNNQLMISSNRCTQHDGLTGADNQANYYAILMKRIFSPTLTFPLVCFHYFRFILIFQHNERNLASDHLDVGNGLRGDLFRLHHLSKLVKVLLLPLIYQTNDFGHEIIPAYWVITSAFLKSFLPIFSEIFLYWNQGREHLKSLGLLLFMVDI